MPELDNKKDKTDVLTVITSRGFLLAALVVVILLLLRQCGETNSAKIEAGREHRNYLAMGDSVRTISKKNGVLIQEKSGLESKVSELTDYQKHLITQLDLKKNGNGNTPKSVVNIVTVYRDSIIKVPSKISKDPKGKEYIDFSYEPKFPGKNKLRIGGKTYYDLSVSKNPLDTSVYVSSIKPGITNLDIEQSIEITTGIYRDPKTKRIMTRVTTEYPNLYFSEINSFDITDNKETRQVLRSARKPFGLGINAGYGLVGGSNGIGTGFYFGVGVSYSPKILQFGK